MVLHWQQCILEDMMFCSSLIYYTFRITSMKVKKIVHTKYGNDNIYKTIDNKKYCCAIIVESSHAQHAGNVLPRGTLVI